MNQMKSHEYQMIRNRYSKVNDPSIKISNDQTLVELIEQLAGVKELAADTSVAKPDNANVSISEAMAIYVHYEIDIEAELAKLQKQKEQTEAALKNIQAKLANKNFVNKAKAEVVEQSSQKLAELTEQLKTIEKHLLELENS